MLWRFSFALRLEPKVLAASKVFHASISANFSEPLTCCPGFIRDIGTWGDSIGNPWLLPALCWLWIISLWNIPSTCPSPPPPSTWPMQAPYCFYLRAPSVLLGPRLCQSGLYSCPAVTRSRPWCQEPCCVHPCIPSACWAPGPRHGLKKHPVRERESHCKVQEHWLGRCPKGVPTSPRAASSYTSRYHCQ